LDKAIIVIAHVRRMSHEHLTELGRARALLRGSLGRRENGEQDGTEDGNNANHNQ
jgi:hypothetical protein